MGILQSAAERSERRIIDALAGMLASFSTLEFGRLDVMCHIEPAETHHGLWVGAKGSREAGSGDDAPGWIGVYRCDGHFWGVLLTAEDLSAVIAREDALVPYMQIARLAGNQLKEPSDLGPMSLGVASLAAVLASIPYETLGDDESATANQVIHWDGLDWEDNGEINLAYLGLADPHIDEDNWPDEHSVDPGQVVTASYESVTAYLQPLVVSDIGLRISVERPRNPRPTPHDHRLTITVEMQDDDPDLWNELGFDLFFWRDLWRIGYDEDSERFYDETTCLGSSASALEVATTILGFLLRFCRDVQFRNVVADAERRGPRTLYGWDYTFGDVTALHGRTSAQLVLATIQSLLKDDGLSGNERSLLTWTLRDDASFVGRIV